MVCGMCQYFAVDPYRRNMYQDMMNTFDYFIDLMFLLQLSLLAE